MCINDYHIIVKKLTTRVVETNTEVKTESPNNHNGTIHLCKETHYHINYCWANNAAAFKVINIKRTWQYGVRYQGNLAPQY